MSESELILGIDYGLRRVGLAMGDSGLKIAIPLEIMDNKGDEFALEKIKAICLREGIGKIVVGLPIGLNGGHGVQTKQVEEFIAKLKRRICLPILAEDERYSTREAEKMLVGKKRRKDDVAAMIILQNYFDKVACRFPGD